MADDLEKLQAWSPCCDSFAELSRPGPLARTAEEPTAILSQTALKWDPKFPMDQSVCKQKLCSNLTDRISLNGILLD